MTFSREQDKAYQKIRAARNRRAEALSKTYRSVADPSQGVDLRFRKGIGARKTAEINAALDVFIRDRVPTAQQVKLINQKYGRYVTASFARVPVPFTPAQIAAGQKMWRDFEAQTTAILTLSSKRPIDRSWSSYVESKLVWNPVPLVREWVLATRQSMELKGKCSCLRSCTTLSK